MKIDPNSGLLEGVRYLASPHCNERPESMPIDMIVVHNISLPPREFGGSAIEAFFCGKLDFTTHPYYQEIADLRVSAHLFINRLGEITQFVPFLKRAWHAGVSLFEGRVNCNDFSIGIELEGTDELPYERIQYTQLARVIQLLQKTYPAIIRERIVGHADIAAGRKTDPGPAFDWQILEAHLK